MNIRLKTEVDGVICNIKNGIRLLLFQRISLKYFYVSHDQLVILVILLSSVIFIGSYILSFPEPEFSIYGIATVATELLFLAFGVYIFSKIFDKKEYVFPLYIALISLWSLFHLLWLAIGKSASINFWELYGENNYVYILFSIWIAVVIVNAASWTMCEYKKSKTVMLGTYVLAFGLPLNYVGFGGFWYQKYDNDSEYEKYYSINQESTYYKQFKLINDAGAQLLPQRIGVTDLYFIGFASYAYQDVFMKEVLYAKNLLDEKYDTEGRSIALINNLETLENTPLASKSNLTLVLDQIGTLIDPDEDILFLYLTSHGSKEHQLAVSQVPLTLNSIGPSDLKAALDRSNIKYRVILVSACYSGGFIEQLKGDYTLVFTASAKDKMSFGCSNENDFTYFGRAVFKEQLENNYYFIDAFSKAIESIRLREMEENLEHSEPQLFVGDKIREKLLILTKEIKEYNHAMDLQK